MIQSGTIRLLPWLVLGLSGVVLTTAMAEAQSERVLPYDAKALFATVVRFVRVNERLAVVEKDADAGYVLFELTDGKRTFRGAFELIPKPQGPRTATRVLLTMHDRPDYLEIAMLDRLEQKVRGELGVPETPRSERKPQTPNKPAEPPGEPGAAPASPAKPTT